MSYYEKLKQWDVVSWLEPLLKNGVYTCRRSDGKFVMPPGYEPTDSPWHHIQYQVGTDCPYLHNHLFQIISPRTPIGQFVPSRCQECWKIVIRPKTLKQLFALEKLLIELALPSKCGIERRKYTPLSKHRYGGYIYNKSHDDGIANLVELRKMLSEHSELNDVECYLKRACTEMEMRFPNSHEWTVSDQQKEIEEFLEWVIVTDIAASMTSKHLIDKVHMTWIEWAAENGDETYLEYTDGKRLYPGCVKYEPPVEGTDEATPDDETVSVGDSSTAVPKENTQTKTKGKKK